jgi:glycosyltransferase involved in cell wall biosynthesis
MFATTYARTVGSRDLTADPVPFPVPPTVTGVSVTAVIPTLNEERNLPWVLRRLPSLVDEVVIIDGRSTDNTIGVAKAVRPESVVVMVGEPGKGAAIRAGFAAASGDVIVMLDADGSMDPAEIHWFVTLLTGRFDFVKGSRYMTGGGSSDLTWLRSRGNRTLTHLANIMCHARFSDLCYGYIGLRRECLPLLELDADGFEIETELVVRAARAGLRIAEIPSYEYGRLSGNSNLRAFRDGRRVLTTLTREWLSWEPATAGSMPESLRRVWYESADSSADRSSVDPVTIGLESVG